LLWCFVGNGVPDVPQVSGSSGGRTLRYIRRECCPQHSENEWWFRRISDCGAQNL